MSEAANSRRSAQGRSLGAVELDRAAGALVGLAAGDALGAGYEFGPRCVGKPEMIGGGLGPWAPGEWTDDTQMAICIAEVTAGGSSAPEAVGERFLRWLAGGPKDVGIQTRAVLGRAASAQDLAATAAGHFHAKPRGAAGNGSLMRTAPVALAHLGDDGAIADAAMEVSLLTHGDPLAGEACVLWCIAIDRALREGRLDGAREGLGQLPAQSRGRWSGWLDEAESQDPGNFSPNGYVVPALQAADAAVHQTPIPQDLACMHLQHALETAVRIGDDTDTVAAIAGSLLGARWGASAVPLRWKALLHGWPGYRTRDLVRLAVLTARAGQPDRTGWPSAENLVPHYRSLGIRGTAVALAEDPWVRIGDAVAIQEERADVVVSLCRMGTADVATGAEHHELWLIDDADPQRNPNIDFMLRDVATSVAGWRAAGRSVFLHCVRAESRTPSVAAAYLAERYGLSGDEALSRVRALLPTMNPNLGFVRALRHNWPGHR